MSGISQKYSRVAGGEDDDDDALNGRTGPDLEENLVGPSRGQVVPVATSVPVMQVVAPATLPEGYEFDAAVGERTIKVRVPPGGVEEGQRFEVPFPQHRACRAPLGG